MKNGDKAFFKSHTINKLGDEIVHNVVSINRYGKILIHVGINDLHELIDSGDIAFMTEHDIIRQYRTLREIIRHHNSRAILLFSSILPHYQDFDVFYPYIYGVNFALEKWCAKSRGGGHVFFIDSKDAFLANGKSRAELYATKNGLHPNGDGDDRLQQMFSQAFSTVYMLDNILSKCTMNLASVSYWCCLVLPLGFGRLVCLHIFVIVYLLSPITLLYSVVVDG